MQEKTSKREKNNILLVGNPNVGKSVIFGLLTGKYATVSNYPGTTVEITSATMNIDGSHYTVIDTPGINNLIPMSEDEKVTRNMLLNQKPYGVIQVIDSKNLKRGLFITIQLAEMGIPSVINLNMIDEARDRGIIIDRHRLSEYLGVEVVETIASQKKGIPELKRSLKNAKIPAIKVDYGEIIEEYVKKIEERLPQTNLNKRAVALMILAGDESLKPFLRANINEKAIEEIEDLRDECTQRLRKDTGLLINAKRLGIAENIASAVTKRIVTRESGFSRWIGTISMHPLFGIPILMLILFLIYEFVGVFGAGTLVDLLENKLFGEYLNPMFTKVISMIIPIKLISDAFIGEYGIITMAITYSIAIIFPITTTFFIAFSILEDCGYLPRLAVMSNRIFRIMGLSGKAVLPLVLGLGCGTMAVMTTRILETTRERILAAFLLALAVPCSAQLGVILGMLGGLSWKATLIWLLSVISVLLIMGYIAKRFVQGESSEFFLEIPPMRMPVLENIVIKTVNRVIWYLKEAVPLFILGTFILYILDKLRLLDILKTIASPVIVSVLGLPEKATEAFLLGFLRRDYGAAGLYAMSEKGLLNPIQSLVSLITITLFIPCLAHFLMMVKEFGSRMAVIIVLVVLPTALIFGGLVNMILKVFNINL